LFGFFAKLINPGAAHIVITSFACT